jgi:hypothetical protein
MHSGEGSTVEHRAFRLTGKHQALSQILETGPTNFNVGSS